MKLGIFLLALGWLFITAGLALAAWSHYYDWDRDTLGICILLILQGVLPFIFGAFVMDEELRAWDNINTQKRWMEAQKKEYDR